MKRQALALCAGLLLLGLLPGSALATTTPSYLDQSNTVLNSTATGELAQTFTAGHSGLLSRVDLWLASLNDPAGGSLSVSIYPTDGSGTPVTTGTALATSASASVAYNAVTGAWIPFTFGSPYSVTAGTMYAIVFNAGGGANVWATYSQNSDAYTRGAAWGNGGSSWTSLQTPPVDDFAFRTYLEDTATANLAWDKTSITAGTSTQLTLTGTLTYIYGGEAIGYSAVLDSLPAWYDPATITITCSWAPGCTLVGLESGYMIGDTSGGATLTFTLVGTASPLAADIPTPGTASGGGCLRYPSPNVLVQPNDGAPGCAEDTASVQVVAPTPTPAPPTPSSVSSLQAATAAPTAAPTKAPTPPPTSTGAGPSSDNTGSTIWFLPFALVASIGGLLLLVDRRRQRLF